MAGLTISRTVAELRDRLAAPRRAGLRIGFVPTMGALHAGHDALVRTARARTDVAVASIFVNPLQFGPAEDLDRYPRPFDADVARLEALGCDHLWHPDPAAMYPPGFGTRVEMRGLVERLCGRSRPVHFGGVMTVVLKLLNQVQPHAAFFGQKDYQQALIVRRMVRDLDVPVAIEVCPTVRERDGLALSSRNAYLDPAERAAAPALRRALVAMDGAFRHGTRDAAALEALGRRTIEAAQGFRIDYLEVTDPEDLERRAGEARDGDLVAVAAWLGRTRLIDNLLLGREPRP